MIYILNYILTILLHSVFSFVLYVYVNSKERILFVLLAYIVCVTVVSVIADALKSSEVTRFQ